MSSFQRPPSALPGISPSRGEIDRTQPAQTRPLFQPSSLLEALTGAQASPACSLEALKTPATRRSPPVRGRCPAGQRGAISLGSTFFLFSPVERRAEWSEAMRGPLVSSFQRPPSALPGISPSRGEIGRTQPAQTPHAFRYSMGRAAIPNIEILPAASVEAVKTPAARRSPPARGRCPAGQRGAILLGSTFFLFSPVERRAEWSEAMRGLRARRSPSSGPAGHLLPAGEKRRLAA